MNAKALKELRRELLEFHAKRMRNPADVTVEQALSVRGEAKDRDIRRAFKVLRKKAVGR